MRYDPDFPHNNPPRRDQDRWSRLDVDPGLPSIETLMARHVPARRRWRDDATRGGAR